MVLLEMTIRNLQILPFREFKFIFDNLMFHNLTENDKAESIFTKVKQKTLLKKLIYFHQFADRVHFIYLKTYRIPTDVPVC